MQPNWDYRIISTRKSDGKVMLITTHIGKQSALMELLAIDACGRNAQIIDIKTNRTITREALES